MKDTFIRFIAHNPKSVEAGLRRNHMDCTILEADPNLYALLKSAPGEHIFLSELTTKGGAVLNWRTDANYGFFFPTSGSLLFSHNDIKEHTHEAQGVFFFGDNESIIEWSKDYAATGFIVPHKSFDRLRAETHGETSLPLSAIHIIDGEDFQRLRRLVVLLIEEANRNPESSVSPGSAITEMALLCVLIESVDPRLREQKREWDDKESDFADLVHAAKMFIDETSALLTIQELTEKLGASPHILYAAFRQQTGLPPRHVMRRWQLEKVRKQIKDISELRPLHEIAREYGFKSYTNFWTAYTKEFKKPPSSDRPFNKEKDD